MQTQDAFALFQNGQVPEAEAACRAVLARAPGDFGALYLSGLIAHQGGDFARAAELLAAAVAVNDADATAQSNYSAALIELERFAEALASADRAIALKPAFKNAHNNRGNALRGLGRLEEAAESYARAIACKPDYAEAHNNRGGALRDLGHHKAALGCFDQAIAHDPAFVSAYHNRARLLEKLGHYAAALADWDAAIGLAPKVAELHNGRGGALWELKRYAEALESHAVAVALNPTFPEAFNNRGVTLNALGRCDEAIADFDRALSLDPRFANAHNNRGVALQEKGAFAEAIQAYECAVKLKPDYGHAQMNLAIAYMQQGDFARGLETYEWRWRNPELRQRERIFAAPAWLGRESLEGKTILLHNEQGLGDAIQFCRYAPMVAARGARVVLEVQRPLARLLATVDGVHQVTIRGEPPPAYDFHCSLLSLPFAFGTQVATIPASRYLAADPARVSAWGEKLGPKTRPRIGLTWSGNPQQQGDRKRSIAFGEFVKALPPGFEYVSLQKEVQERDQAALAARPDIRDFSSALTDFAETAALCAHMDLVVTVCTSTAHLAGALGTPTWVLLCLSPCWRWLLGRNDSPWYPSVTLYRQTVPGAWDSVLANVRADLSAQLP